MAGFCSSVLFGWIVPKTQLLASAKNGFQNTSIKDCSGKPFGFHAEYNTAKKQNQTPWAALEGGVLMQQEIGHGESCSSVTNKLSFSMKFTDGSSFKDPQVFQTCVGGIEGKGKSADIKARVAMIQRELASASSLEADLRAAATDKTAKAKQVGELVASRAKAAGIESVVFDRPGNKYTGRVAALAEGAREGGLAF